ncbi:MAG: hypothetical protein KDA53_02270 [Hyphomonas sp.]|nr:hypothetical protein [Hyphomonas sp.]
MAKKTWTEKLNSGAVREVKSAPKDFADIKAGQRMLLTTAKDVADYVSHVPEGQEVDITSLRAGLAKEARADIACPVVTGICLRIVAEYAGEKLDAGIAPSNVPPVWRAMPASAPIWKKIENGKKQFLRLRRSEGLAV